MAWILVAQMTTWWRWRVKQVAEEPFRVFFPLGLLAGMWGVMLWPMMYLGWLKFYPGEPHARMMVEGMMGAFVVGFLGTAFPRMVGHRPLLRGELAVLLGLWLAVAVSQGGGRVAAGDMAFAGLLAATGMALLARWVFGHRDTPPPGFVLAMAGVFGGALAAGCLGWRGGWWMSGPAIQWARLWLYQGTLLLPLLGVAGTMVPRFFGMPSAQHFDDSPRPPAGWWRRFALSASWGGLVVASFAIEVAGWPVAAYLLRAATIGTAFAFETPVWRRATQPGTAANALRWAVGGLLAGCIGAAMVPAARVATLHLLLVSGIGLITLVVAMRVVLGHAGRHDLLGGKIVWLRWLVGLVILAATTRTSADFLPQIRVSHHIYAAWTWVAVSAMWLGFVGRFLLRSDEPAPVPERRCPKRRRGESEEADSGQ